LRRAGGWRCWSWCDDVLVGSSIESSGWGGAESKRYARRDLELEYYCINKMLPAERS
jgi:hypothetical protein